MSQGWASSVPGAARMRPRRRAPRGLPALLLPLLLSLLPLPSAQADPVYEGPLLYGLDPVLRATDRPALLGVERLVMRNRLLRLGIDPLRTGGGRPGLHTTMRHLFDEKARADLRREEVLVEYNGNLNLMTVITYPRFLYLFPAKETLPGGFVYYPPRPTGDPDVRLFVDDLATGLARRHEVARKDNRSLALSVVGGGKLNQGDDGLINLTIPIKLPRTLEKIIGRGEKTRIKITGRERLALTGESTVVKPFTPNERISSQSLFPSLNMEQELQINLSGTIGEKIIMEVDHNSAVIGPDGTKIKLMYRGTDDEIIKTIETGDVGLTLPNSQLLGYSSNKSGLFGIKVTGQIGRAEFTLVASKQKAEASSKTFNSKGGSVDPKEFTSDQFIRNRFFKLFSGTEPAYDPNLRVDRTSIRVYRKLPTGQAGENDINWVSVFDDPDGGWPVPARGDTAYYSAQRWTEVPYELMLDTQGRIYALDLGQTSILDTDYLAVAFTVTDTLGTFVRQVGDDPAAGQAPSRQIANDPGQLYYALKLLKAPANLPETHSFGFEVRNIYPLGGTNIDPATFQFRIERIENVSNPDLDESVPPTPYIQIFGLDLENSAGGPPDGRPDAHRREIFDLERGLLMFPIDVPKPFAPDNPELLYTFYARFGNPDWTYEADSYLARNQKPELYLASTQTNNLAQYGAFKLVAEHAAVSSSFNLGASNIQEDSEVVTVNGQTLSRGIDYEIDYTFGELTLKGQYANLAPDAQVSVTYQYSPFFGGGNTSLIGANIGYDLGRDSKLSTTWLYQSQSIVGEKAKLGEEPNKTIVGNINLAQTFRPGFLTTVANILSRHNTEKESTVQFSGELALSLPNPNTKGVAYLEDFEGVDSSDIISLVRTAWFWGSVPQLGSRWSVENGDFRQFEAAGRVDAVRWFLPKDRVPRRWLNPDLVNQERDETQQVMSMYLRDDDLSWDDNDWGGIMRGVSRTGLDLAKAQFVEIWVNDGQQDLGSRTGRLHIDFGTIDEDGFWGRDGPDTLVTGTFEREDGITGNQPDGIYTQDEDIGLDGGGIDGPQRFNSEYNAASDPYPFINGTANNQKLDTEDINGDDQLNRLNGYFTTTIDLRDTEALVDVVYDYDELDDMPANQAWRKYRVPIGQVDSVGTTANLNAVTHVRIWFEDTENASRFERTIQLSEFRFLGSRWEREGVRRAADEALLGEADRVPGEEFFLGEVNNKENPDYQPPFTVNVENNIPEKEQALVLNFANLDRGHMMRSSKQVSARGDDYTGYAQLSWYWYNPSPRTADVDLFFRVGADTLNYYEVSYRFAAQDDKIGWQPMRVNIAELSNVKNEPVDDDGVRRGTVTDTRSLDVYPVRVVGRPDLRAVKRYYFGIVNRALEEPVSGYFYLNDVKLEGVKRDPGLAERAGLRVNMADVIKVDFDWSHRDQEFHGLDSRRGSGVDNTDWSLSTNFAINDFIPLLGFRLPVALARRQTILRPKYETNSDIEIIDNDVRNLLSTLEERESFSTRFSHTPAKSAILRYAVDPWILTLSGARSSRTSPTEDRKQKSLQGSVSYDLRIPGNYTLGKYPLFKYVPILRSLSIVPKKIAFGGSFTSTQTDAETIDEFGVVTARPQVKNRPAILNAGLDYNPLSILTLALSGKSDRDLLRPSEKFGVNIGAENKRSYNMTATITPPLVKELGKSAILKPVRTFFKGVNTMRPSLQFIGGYAEDRTPGTVQVNDPDGTRSVSNNGNWEFRFSVPVGDAVKSVFPEKRYSDADRQRMLREQEQREQMASRRGASDLPPVQLTEEEKEGLTPDQIIALEEEKRLEAAQRFEDEERLAQEQIQGRPAPLAGEDGGLKFPNPLTLVLNTLRNMTPVKVTWTDKRTASYARYYGPMDFWFKTGLLSSLDAGDSLSVTYAEQDRKTVNIAATTKMTRDLSFDLKFGQNESERDQAGAKTKNYQQDWPDLQVSLSGIERWRVFGGGGGPDSGWFRSSSFNISYKRSKTVNNMSANLYNPNWSTTMGPRWSATFQSGLTATLTMNKGHDRNESNGVVTDKNRLRVGLQVRHQIRAQGFLARLGLYRPGSNPSVNMDIDLSWDRDRTERTNPGGSVIEPTGLTRWALNPRFSYQITRNLSGALRFIFNRSSNLASGQTTTSLGMGLEATFVF